MNTSILVAAISVGVMVVALGTWEACRYLRLICPPCGPGCRTGNNFLFTKTTSK